MSVCPQQQATAEYIQRCNAKNPYPTISVHPSKAHMVLWHWGNTRCHYFDKCQTTWMMEEKKHHIIKRCNTCKFEIRIPKPGNVEHCYDCETPIETRLLGKWCSSCKKDVVFKVNIELGVIN